MISKLIPLNLPPAPLKLAQKDGIPVVWDHIRGKYLKLTPEEWVRQHFVHFLMQNGYRKGSIMLEGGFRNLEKMQRTDILIYKNGNPALLVECKAPQVQVGQPTFDQASRYNLHYRTSYVAVTNGIQHFCAKADHAGKKYQFLQKIPSYNEL